MLIKEKSGMKNLSVREAPQYPSIEFSECSFRLENFVDMDSARSASVGANYFVLEKIELRSRVALR